jgi:hypothetical protein
MIEELVGGSAFGVGDGVPKAVVEFRAGVWGGGLVEGEGSGAFIIPPTATTWVWGAAGHEKGGGGSIDVGEEGLHGEGDIVGRGEGEERRRGAEGKEVLPGDSEVIVNGKAMEKTGGGADGEWRPSVGVRIKVPDDEGGDGGVERGGE